MMINKCFWPPSLARLRMSLPRQVELRMVIGIKLWCNPALKRGRLVNLGAVVGW